MLDTRAEYLELVRNWGADKSEEFLHCRLPFALQQIAGGLKISVPLSLIGAVLGEFMGGSEGLGYVIVSSGANYRLDRSFASLVILSLIGIASLAFVRFLQEIVLRKFKQE
jgi:ABC-type nitrate/sulfonate/bicarbonate transport system permease component